MQSLTRITLAALLTFTISPSLATAQGEKLAKPEPEAASSPSRPPKPQPQPFVLTVLVKESDSGKSTLEKSYTLSAVADDDSSMYANLRDGDRIPYMGEKGREYYDVGTNIDVQRPARRGDTIAMGLSLTSSSLVAKTDGVNLPQITRWSISVFAFLVPGKPTVVYSATDAITGHKVEIQATAQPVNAR